MNQIRTFAFILLFVLSLPGLAAKPEVIPNQWIVELEHAPTLEYRGTQSLPEEKLFSEVAAFQATAPEGGRFVASAPHVQAYAEFLDRERSDTLSLASGQIGRDLQPLAEYRHVLNGFSVRMSAEEARQVEVLPGVRRVRQDVAYRPQTDDGPRVIGAPNVWTGPSTFSSRGEGVVIGIIDTGINADHRYFSDDPVHTGGYVHTNPLGEQLGECSRANVACNDKLIGVWDFAEENTFGLDPDGHGTHVAATAAGNPWSFSLSNVQGTFSTSGVAPRANIISYKVCYSDDFDDEDLAGRCAGAGIAQALEQAVEDGVDIINYSIGGTASDPWQTATAFLNVRNAGILFVSSAGNSGPELGTMTGPAHAPWVLSVGSTTHGRRIGSLVDVAGLTGLSVEPGTGPSLQEEITAPVIAADDAGSSLEGCSAYASDAFDGAIAFIIRGGCTFEDKVNNAAAAGAVAVLVYNNESGAGPIVMGGLESTSIPAAMLGNADGVQARSAIQATTDPEATLYLPQRRVNSDWQDRVSGFSSRGPGAGAPGVMKPDVMAPGQDILAGYIPDDNSVARTSGTSMASPHVAGAAALLKAIHPDWTPAVLHSVLATTAEADPVRVGSRSANMMERGAGRIRVDRAARAGLYLPVSSADFVAANPGSGGNPEQLNLPGLNSMSCAQSCTFVRTVRAIESGSWTVSTEGDLDITVTPGSFSLNAGQQRELTIEVKPGDVMADEFGEGSVVLTPEDDGMATQRLPVGVLTVFADLPDIVEMEVESNRGRFVETVQTGALLEPVLRTSALVLPRKETALLLQDPTPDDPYSGGAGTQTYLVDVPEDTLMLYAEVVASSSNDIDLFVGRDDNNDGVAQASEEVCRSIGPDEFETCVIEFPEPGQWWVLVQNWDASGFRDPVELEIAVLVESEDDSLAALAPARHEGGALDLEIHFDQPGMKRDERWMGAIAMASVPEEAADVGMIPLRIVRTADKSAEPTALFSGQSRYAVIAGGGEDRLTYFDVPPGTASVSVSVEGEDSVSAELVRMDFDDVFQAAPGTPSASGTVMASGSGSSGGFEMNAGGQPGRWYVVLSNSGSQERRVTVTVELEETDPVRSQRGLWSPLDRSIRQGIEWQRAGPGFVTWYSYDADGLPVFYQAIAEIAEDSSIWRAPLYRITNATGVRQNAYRVGEMSLTMLDDDSMIFTWRMEGFHGSDRMKPDAARTCPEDGAGPVNVSGHWNAPGTNTGGTTVIVNAAVQAHIRYYFDLEGIGRWVLASDPEEDPFNEVLEVYDFRGFCPSCGESEITHQQVGLFMREFFSDSEGRETLDFITAPPLNHEINFEIDVSKMSEAMSCR